MKKVVIALGGNAILKKGDKPVTETQEKNTKIALKRLFPIIKKNKIVITHGNGPQAGYLLLQQEKAGMHMPLDVLDAETEGQIGYLIQQNLQNLFGGKRGVVTVLTQVLVDKQDSAFRNPTKFVGPFYTKAQARKLGKKFKIKKDSNRGYRRVVPSPKPIKIIEKKIINDILNDNAVVIAAGGGGIPVVKNGNSLDGIEAVIDKDRASQCLASSIKADMLIMITDVDRVYLNYKKKGQRALKNIKLEDLKKYYLEGHFPPGNMGPKVESAIKFLESGGKKVIISGFDIDEGTVVMK